MYDSLSLALSRYLYLSLSSPLSLSLSLSLFLPLPLSLSFRVLLYIFFVRFRSILRCSVSDPSEMSIPIKELLNILSPLPKQISIVEQVLWLGEVSSSITREPVIGWIDR